MVWLSSLLIVVLVVVVVTLRSLSSLLSSLSLAYERLKGKMPAEHYVSESKSVGGGESVLGKWAERTHALDGL